MSPAERRLSIDLTSITAEAITDADGLPALVIRDRDLVLELSGGAHLDESKAGARRIVAAVWDYQLAVEMQRLARSDTPE